IGAVVGLAVEDRDAGVAAGAIHLYHAFDDAGRLDRRRPLRVAGVEVHVQGIEEEHRRLRGDDGKLGHPWGSSLHFGSHPWAILPCFPRRRLEVSPAPVYSRGAQYPAGTGTWCWRRISWRRRADSRIAHWTSAVAMPPAPSCSIGLPWRTASYSSIASSSIKAIPSPLRWAIGTSRSPSFP